MRYVGWSNVTGWQLQKIVDESRRLGVTVAVSLQAQYSLLCRQIEWELVDVCDGEKVALLPWSPLKVRVAALRRCSRPRRGSTACPRTRSHPQGGWLSGKVKRDGSGLEGTRISWAEATGSKMQSHPTLSAFKDDDRVWALLDAMAEMGTAYGASVAQVALRWVLQRRAVTSIVIGVKSVAQLADNLGCLRFALSDAEMARLEALSDIGKPYPYEMVWRVQTGRTRTAATTAAAGAGVAAGGAGASAAPTPAATATATATAAAAAAGAGAGAAAK